MEESERIHFFRFCLRLRRLWYSENHRFPRLNVRVCMVNCVWNIRACMDILIRSYLPNKYSWTFNVVMFSHPGEFQRDLSDFWYICPTEECFVVKLAEVSYNEKTWQHRVFTSIYLVNNPYIERIICHLLISLQFYF